MFSYHNNRTACRPDCVRAHVPCAMRIWWKVRALTSIQEQCVSFENYVRNFHSNRTYNMYLHIIHIQRTWNTKLSGRTQHIRAHQCTALWQTGSSSRAYRTHTTTYGCMCADVTREHGSIDTQTHSHAYTHTHTHRTSISIFLFWLDRTIMSIAPTTRCWYVRHGSRNNARRSGYLRNNATHRVMVSPICTRASASASHQFRIGRRAKCD